MQQEKKPAKTQAEIYAQDIRLAKKEIMNQYDFEGHVDGMQEGQMMEITMDSLRIHDQNAEILGETRKGKSQWEMEGVGMQCGQQQKKKFQVKDAFKGSVLQQGFNAVCNEKEFGTKGGAYEAQKRQGETDGSRQGTKDAQKEMRKCAITAPKMRVAYNLMRKNDEAGGSEQMGKVAPKFKTG